MNDLKKAFHKDITERVEQEILSISMGSASDFISYKSRCEYLRGLKDSLEVFESIYKKFFDESDDNLDIQE